MNATEWIAKQRELCEAVDRYSPLKWAAFQEEEDDYCWSVQLLEREKPSPNNYYGISREIPTKELAKFIASTRTSLPAALDALEAAYDYCEKKAAEGWDHPAAIVAYENVMDIITTTLAEATA